MSGLGKDTIWLEGSDVKRNESNVQGKVIRHNYCHSLDRLKVGDRVGLKYFSNDGSLKFFINGEDCGLATGSGSNFPGKLYPVVELYGSTISVSSISSCHQIFGTARSQVFSFSVLNVLKFIVIQKTDEQNFQRVPRSY